MSSELNQSIFKFRSEQAVKKFKNIPNNQAGFMTAEFLFAFTMVIGSGILIFALTFALTTIEIAQYIVWTSARAHAVGNIDAESSIKAGETKYANITAAFPLLTGNGADSPWFKMPSVNNKGDFLVGDLSDQIKRKDSAIDKFNSSEPGGEARQPWIGIEASIDLILLSGLQVPFLGKVTETPEDFKFPIRAVLFRHPSTKECQNFFNNKFTMGVKALPQENNSSLQGTMWKNLSTAADGAYAPMEDNGC